MKKLNEIEMKEITGGSIWGHVWDFVKGLAVGIWAGGGTECVESTIYYCTDTGACFY